MFRGYSVALKHGDDGDLIRQAPVVILGQADPAHLVLARLCRDALAGKLPRTCFGEAVYGAAVGRLQPDDLVVMAQPSQRALGHA